MKYVIVRDQFHSECAILFDEGLDHSVIKMGVIAAGFCSLGGTTDSNGACYMETSCWGQSITLGISSRQEDVVLIDQAVRRR